MVTEEYSYARARARLPLKVTVPSPLVLYGCWSPRYSTARLLDPFAMFADAAEIGRSEIQELVSLGCEYIQVDAPELATLVDPRIPTGPSAGCRRRADAHRGHRADQQHGRGDLRRAAGHPPLPRQQRRPVEASGGATIAERAVRARTAFDAYFLEYDDSRSGSFEPLAGAPDDKQIVLGLVRPRRRELETPMSSSARIDDAARSSRASSSASRPSAASRRALPATRSPRTPRSASCGWSPTFARTPPGARLAASGWRQRSERSCSRLPWSGPIRWARSREPWLRQSALTRRDGRGGGRPSGGQPREAPSRDDRTARRHLR